MLGLSYGMKGQDKGVVAARAAGGHGVVVGDEEQTMSGHVCGPRLVGGGFGWAGRAGQGGENEAKRGGGSSS